MNLYFLDDEKNQYFMIRLFRTDINNIYIC